MNTCYIPNTLEELGEALGRLTENSLILAGGTDLVLRLRSKNLQPDALLSLGSVPALREIEITPERASIGAMATMAEIKKAVEALAVKYHPNGEKAGRQREIEKFWETLCMMELSIEHICGKEGLELLRERQ